VLHPKSTNSGLLFLATLPDANTASRIYRSAEAIKHARRFEGGLIRHDGLHVTLFSLSGLPEHFLWRAYEAAAAVRMRPFDVSFDRTLSFRGKPGNHPFVLVGGDGVQRLRLFRQKLAAAMMSSGLRRWACTDFTPHVTLLYDSRSAEEHPVEPIGWSVSEFALIHSMRGHIRLAQWRLRG
jgi:2'-5' RNA ligase